MQVLSLKVLRKTLELAKWSLPRSGDEYWNGKRYETLDEDLGQSLVRIIDAISNKHVDDEIRDKWEKIITDKFRQIWEELNKLEPELPLKSLRAGLLERTDAVLASYQFSRKQMLSVISDGDIDRIKDAALAIEIDPELQAYVPFRDWIPLAKWEVECEWEGATEYVVGVYDRLKLTILNLRPRLLFDDERDVAPDKKPDNRKKEKKKRLRRAGPEVRAVARIINKTREDGDFIGYLQAAKDYCAEHGIKTHTPETIERALQDHPELIYTKNKPDQKPDNPTSRSKARKNKHL